jgi:hypothetical protein
LVCIIREFLFKIEIKKPDALNSEIVKENGRTK